MNRFIFLKQWRETHILPVVFTVLLALGILPALLFSLRSESEAGSAVLFGYSLERLILSGGLLIIFFVFSILAVTLMRHPMLAKKMWEAIFLNSLKTRKIFLAAGLVFLFTWIILFLPDYRLGKLTGYISQLKPTIIWLAFASGLAVLFTLFGHDNSQREKSRLGSKSSLFIWAAIFALFVITTGIPFVFSLGLQNPEDYWYPTGVPVLGLQVIFSILAGVWMMFFEQNQKNGLKNRFDIFVCIFIFAATAFIWAMEPVHPNYFMPDTADNLMFPYSDSATYDISSQFALIGQGLFNGGYFDRALYTAFLTYSHMLFGQNYDAMLFAQAVIFAVFPVIIYLIGRELHGRALGISAAMIISLRGYNSLVSAGWLDTASPKMILTDFAAVIGVAAIVLFSLRWIKDPSNAMNAILAGASLGLTIMLRTNVVLLIPVILAYFWWVWKKTRKLMLIGIVLFVIGMISFTTPWDIRNRKNGIPMFYVYYSRIETVLRNRYGIGSTINSPSLQSVALGDASRSTRQRIVEIDDVPYCSGGICKVSNHLFHNYITSILYLPSSFVLDDLWNTVKLSTPYWLNSWRGDGLGLGAGLFILLNLAIVSLGVVFAWLKNKVLSFVPLIFFGAYITSNSLALTSGGRYIVPIDWIFLLYFMLGVLAVAEIVLRYGGFISVTSQTEIRNETEKPVRPLKGQFKKTVGAVFFVFILGSLVPLSEVPFQQRYQNESITNVLNRLEDTGVLEDSPFSREELDLFLAQPDSVLRVGRLLYPRYYLAGEGEADRHYPYVQLEYPRLVFQMIGPFPSGREYVIIAGKKPRYDFHALDVVVIGCRSSVNIDRSTHINGLLVFIFSESSDVYFNKPMPELKCPPETTET